MVDNFKRERLLLLMRKINNNRYKYDINYREAHKKVCKEAYIPKSSYDSEYKYTKDITSKIVDDKKFNFSIEVSQYKKKYNCDKITALNAIFNKYEKLGRVKIS